MATITRTDRLILVPLTVELEDEAHQIYSDSRIWEHRPQARHTNVRVTRDIIKRTNESWGKKDLGPWGVYLRDRPSEFVGVGGVELIDGKVWDLKYRLRPDLWGNGYATEISNAATLATKRIDDSLPLTARVTTNHPASFHILEKLGLTPVWEGRRVGTEDDPNEPDVRIYSDRPLSDEILEMLKQRP
ncbi:GNAT family N-acetyltransferase [Corynebacterium glutamicum]|uniref:GNAT family N-acetyltransferase n=1 Tax=Corynebacterium glutamicum TaxID=1718 RepID=UPI0004F61EEC|nr:GNAT family N-acetyltransferase [Corynebacterium glutamicum]AIK87883.1 acetyltransferase [Corynebacterium glutamicum]AJE67365.1 acetyltransferase [Corynebacterium glutamicum]AMA00085.1 acetyltransferase [Corynebacterium glutamicum]MDO5373614.1 GNAT family N-acetyltransferase [Corynebacterium glutamicum]OKX78599.1 GNAT family N-acetyltransferase [Corynebacterium glutamicum]